jgi:DNA-binding transcriptional regulator YdaS (Cro superfamily)
MEKLTDWIKAERGRLTKLAADLKVTPSAITQWRKVPAERIWAVSKSTGIKAHDLRPDIFPSSEPAQ